MSDKPIDLRQARHIMFTLLEARFEAATLQDLESLHARLSGLVTATGNGGSQADDQVLLAMAELVFVEARLREQHVDVAVRRLLDGSEES
jgi:hypothetical protein